MTRRREVLEAFLLGLLALSAAAPPGAAAPRAPRPAPEFVPKSVPKFVIVNGWVLTEADLARLDARAR